MEQQPNISMPTIQDLVQAPSANDGGIFYVPSSIQKKRALLMYFLMGIVMVIEEKKTNEFEYFHLKQAIWWRTTFLALLLLCVLLLFIPYVQILGILWLVAWVALLVVFAKQARDGIYKKNRNTYRWAIFPSLGNRIVSLFDLSFDDTQSSTTPTITQ